MNEQQAEKLATEIVILVDEIESLGANQARILRNSIKAKLIQNDEEA